MATVTGFTAARMLAMENATVINGSISGDNLTLITRGGTHINAGDVRGPVGPPGFPNPVGTFIMGGWPTDPDGYLILDGRTITDGVSLYAALAAMFTAWVSGNNIILPNATDVVPMASSQTPGVVSGSMTHTLSSISQLPPHKHAGPSHTHDIRHPHSDNFTASSSGANQEMVRRLATVGPGFWTGINDDLDSHLDIAPNHPQPWPQILAGMRVDASWQHNHPVTMAGSVTAAPAGTLSQPQGTGDTSEVGSSASINHEPRNIKVRMAVKT